MDCSLPGFSVHRIFHTRILEWVTISFFKESSWPRDWTWAACFPGRFSTIWDTREAPGCFCSKLCDQKTFQRYEHPLLPFLNSSSGSWACLRHTPLLCFCQVLGLSWAVFLLSQFSVWFWATYLAGLEAFHFKKLMTDASRMNIFTLSNQQDFKKMVNPRVLVRV